MKKLFFKKYLFLFLIQFFYFESLNGQTQKWTKFHEYDNGDIKYIDVENIRVSDGFLYWYDLVDYLEPSNNLMSMSSYNKGDCKEMKSKYLNIRYFLGQMGTHFLTSRSPPDLFTGWFSTTPGEVGHKALKFVCEVKKNQKIKKNF